MIRQNSKHTLLTIFLCFYLVGCSSSPTQVGQAVPEESAYGEETLDMRNCDSNDEMVTTLADQAPVKQQISISEQATVIETGSAIDIPNKVHDELKLQVKNEYQPIFEEAVANAKKVELTIPGHKIYMYKIYWNHRIYRSTISFTINNQACTAPYVYTLETPILDSYTVMACTA